MKFRIRSDTVVEATAWFKNGDHPDDACETLTGSDGKPFMSEGKVVRYYRHPGVSGKAVCPGCKKTMHEHGWLDIGGDGWTVCPGDWVITDSRGQRSSRSNASFMQFYERVI